MKALIFDCDGVLVDTERDGHRVAFNRAFSQQGLKVEWSVELYGDLLAISGGKERMRHYFERRGWPSGVVEEGRDAFIRELHARKTDLFMRIIDSGELPLRSGVARIVDEAIGAGVQLAVCSTSNERSVNLIVEKLLGPHRTANFSEILAGDIVQHKKPDPEIYNLARERLGVSAQDCVVVEDNRNGLLAAKAAGMTCLVTTSAYSAEEDFSEADHVVAELGDPPDAMLTLSEIVCLSPPCSGRKANGTGNNQ
ncbi:MAG: HAD family hydrolase [Verrucomicrobia bacterium]|nr:MAG: HAD family hydrolase [Verrucomicrobiota bacterium]